MTSNYVRVVKPPKLRHCSRLLARLGATVSVVPTDKTRIDVTLSLPTSGPSRTAPREQRDDEDPVEHHPRHADQPNGTATSKDAAILMR